MKQNKKMHNRFHKLVNHIVQKQSPSDLHPETKPLTDDDDDAAGIEEEAGAVDQEGSKAKRKPRDYDPNNLL